MRIACVMTIAAMSLLTGCMWEFDSTSQLYRNGSGERVALDNGSYVCATYSERGTLNTDKITYRFDERHNGDHLYYRARIVDDEENNAFGLSFHSLAPNRYIVTMFSLKDDASEKSLILFGETIGQSLFIYSYAAAQKDDLAAIAKRWRVTLTEGGQESWTISGTETDQRTFLVALASSTIPIKPEVMCAGS